MAYEGAAQRGHGHAVLDGEGDEAAPEVGARCNLLGDLGVEQQVGQLGLTLEGGMHEREHTRPDNAPAPPDLGKLGEGQRPPVRLGGGSQLGHALCVAAELAAVERGLARVRDRILVGIRIRDRFRVRVRVGFGVRVRAVERGLEPRLPLGPLGGREGPQPLSRAIRPPCACVLVSPP